MPKPRKTRNNHAGRRRPVTIDVVIFGFLVFAPCRPVGAWLRLAFLTALISQTGAKQEKTRKTKITKQRVAGLRRPACGHFWFFLVFLGFVTFGEIKAMEDASLNHAPTGRQGAKIRKNKKDQK